MDVTAPSVTERDGILVPNADSIPEGEARVGADQLPPRILGGGTVAEAGRRKLQALDGIRGVAVLAVMCAHFERFLPPAASLAPVRTVMTYGWVGVDLFFVLSGFLITGILLQTRTAVNYFQSFYIRRFLRIFPIYYLTLFGVFGVLALAANIPNVPPPNQRWSYFLYLQNWIPFWTGVWPPNVLGHFWSLAVEEQFYLVWPACVLLLSPRALLRTAVLLCAGILIARCIWVLHAGATPALMLGTPTRIDTLLFGSIAALMFTRSAGLSAPRNLPLISTVALTAVAVGVIITTWHGAPSNSFGFIASVGYTLLATGFGALVLYAALRDGCGGLVQRIFCNRTLGRVGQYSYGMYVYHVPLLGGLELLVYRHLPIALRANPLFGLLYIAVLAAGTFAVAAVSFKLIEAPLLRLKRKAEPQFELHAQVS